MLLGLPNCAKLAELLSAFGENRMLPPPPPAPPPPKRCGSTNPCGDAGLNGVGDAARPFGLP